jgi:hypothetical protein
VLEVDGTANTTMAAMDQRITQSVVLSGTSIRWLRKPLLLNPLASSASDLVSTEIKAPARSGIIMAKRACTPSLWPTLSEFGGRQMGLYVGPFGIGGADLVCTFHTRYFIEPPSQDTFSDGFSRRLGELGQKETVYFEDAWSSRCCY